jgi:hypothetical protein
MQRCTKVTCATRPEEKVRVTSQLTVNCSPITLRLPRARFKRTLRCDAGVIALREPSQSLPPSIMEDDFQAAIA